MKEIITLLLESFFNAIAGSMLDKKISCLEKQAERAKLLKKLKDWCFEFTKNYDGTIVSFSEFTDCLKNYNIIQHIIEYYVTPKGISEKEFIQDESIKLHEMIKSKRDTTSNDINIIKEFISGIYNAIADHFENSENIHDVATWHYVSVIKGITADILQNQKNADCNSDAKSIPKHNIIKKAYTYPENTIRRFVADFSDIQKGYYHLYFGKIERKSLYEVCCSKKQVVLRGEAGAGKSIVLKQLAAEVSDSEYYPVYFDLKHYTSQEISKIIESVYSDFSCINTFLILDGFDEIGSNHRSNFVIEINKFVSFFPEVPVLVSTRNNFYEFCDDRGENSLFSGFAEIGICPITSVEIKDYLEENGVSYKTFESEVSKQEIYELTSNPFYLKELVTLFKESGCLPKKVDLLDEIINRRFKYDSGKFKNIKTISRFKVMMFACLRKIAFAMQCNRVFPYSISSFFLLLSVYQFYIYT